MEEEIFTPEDVSKYLRVSMSSVYKFINSGELEAYKVGRLWKIKRSDLEAFADYLGKREELPD